MQTNELHKAVQEAWRKYPPVLSAALQYEIEEIIRKYAQGSAALQAEIDRLKTIVCLKCGVPMEWRERNPNVGYYDYIHPHTECEGPPWDTVSVTRAQREFDLKRCLGTRALNKARERDLERQQQEKDNI